MLKDSLFNSMELQDLTNEIKDIVINKLNLIGALKEEIDVPRLKKVINIIIKEKKTRTFYKIGGCETLPLKKKHDSTNLDEK